MSFAPTSYRSPLPPIFSSSSFPFKLSTTILRKLPLNPPKNPRSIISSSSSNQRSSPFNSEESVLDAVAGFDVAQKSLPAIRTFENDLARLSIAGAVDFHQAITAGAADGGDAADEHISSDIPAMVVETIFPAGDHSTVSTRLFLPAKKVKEKAIKLKRSFTKGILDGTTSKNILAMTFRQVVLQHLWNFELALYKPGSERNMDDLENPREVPVLLNICSSDERMISEIAEVVYRAILKNTETDFHHNSTNTALNKIFSWFNKGEIISSGDSSVILYNFLGHEIVENAKKLLQNFNLERGYYKLDKVKNSKAIWWTSPAFTKLEKIGGPEFCAWISECIPSYKLVIDASKLGDAKFEGFKNSKANSWEVILTHSQMVCLADILDMYYEDVFTLPYKRLSCHAVAKSSNLALNKGISLMKMLSVVIVSAVFLVTVSVLKKVYMPHLFRRNIYSQEHSQSGHSDFNSVPLHYVKSSELENCCVSVIRRIKDSFGSPGEIRTSSINCCAWIGELPTYLRKVDAAESSVLDIVSSTSTLMPEANDDEMKALQDITSYQVVLSTDGNIIGLQPTSRVTVNNWAANPLTKELYGGKILSPGLLEPGLKISYPNGVVVLELLMSINPDSCFAMARAFDNIM